VAGQLRSAGGELICCCRSELRARVFLDSVKSRYPILFLIQRRCVMGLVLRLDLWLGVVVAGQIRSLSLIFV
jgi:hypothetical protein